MPQIEPATSFKKAKGTTKVAVSFDDLPNSALVGSRTVKMLFDISDPTLFRWLRAGKLPRPVNCGGGDNRWRAGDLRKILSQNQSAT